MLGLPVTAPTRASGPLFRFLPRYLILGLLANRYLIVIWLSRESIGARASEGSKDRSEFAVAIDHGSCAASDDSRPQ